jgi:hypothetical protein
MEVSSVCLGFLQNFRGVHDLGTRSAHDVDGSSYIAGLEIHTTAGILEKERFKAELQRVQDRKLDAVISG